MASNKKQVDENDKFFSDELNEVDFNLEENLIDGVI